MSTTNIVFNRIDLVAAGWGLSVSEGTVIATHDLEEEGPATMTLRDEGDSLVMSLPDNTQQRVHLFLAFNETSTRHEIV